MSSSPTRSVSPRLAGWIVFTMLAMVAAPAAITLHEVRAPAILTVPPDPTPHGYTWSLLLFIIPIAVIAGWFLPSEGLDIPQRAFWRTIRVLVPAGFALDFFFAHRFFSFPNPAATLGIGAWALHGPVPIEEYVFYFTGFITILLIYIWLDEFWLAAYNLPDYPGEARQIRRLLQFHPSSAVLGGAAIAAAVVYKRLFSSTPQGLPEYFTVLVLGGLVPSASFFPVVRPFINWRALSLTLFIILLVSLFWEATLAIPYGWWGYRPERMTGISIRAWSGLPFEAVLVWMAVTYATVILFEACKLWQASGRTFREAFLGA